MRILQLTVHYEPNVGGVETHLSDLVRGLISKRHEVFVLTYRPLITETKWKIWEKKRNLSIFRISWIPGYFHKLSSLPMLQFIYLVLGIFLITPFILLIKKPEVIHSHGLIAGFVAVFWGKIFGKRVITTTHSIYSFPKKGIYRGVAKWIFAKSDTVLTLSRQSKKEIENIGIPSGKVINFTYWIDLNRFKPIKNAKKKLRWTNFFVVLFVGRLVKEKGILVALDAARKWSKNINFVIAGEGPLKERVTEIAEKNENIVYLGRVLQDKLPVFYSAADVLLVPSAHEEGFGRVILEALVCGTPVVASNRGAIPEAMDENVGRLIELNAENIINTIERLREDRRMLLKLSRNAYKYAIQKYSKSNMGKIIHAYSQ